MAQQSPCVSVLGASGFPGGSTTRPFTLKVLSWFGIVWDLQTPPTVVRGEQRLGRKVIEKVARQLAGAFPIERIAAQAHEPLAKMPTWAELDRGAGWRRGHAEAFLAEIHLPHMPSVEEIRGYAEQRLARTVSLDEIARRTHQVLLEAVAVRLLNEAETARQRDLFATRAGAARPKGFRHQVKGAHEAVRMPELRPAAVFEDALCEQPKLGITSVPQVKLPVSSMDRERLTKVGSSSGGAGLP